MGDVILMFNKVLSLFFIFTIPSVNLWLIGNFLYWKNIFSKDKKCILASVAISDVLIGMFYLPVEATLYFEIYLGGPGCILSYVHVYSQFFAPFVYGIGISVLSVELILRGSNKSFYNCSKLLTFLVAMFPWLMAVIIVLPLTFIGRPDGSCWYIPLNVRGICIWAFSTFVPIFLCMVMWVITAFVKWSATTTFNMSRNISRDSSRHTCPETGPASQSLMGGERQVMEEARFSATASPDIANYETSLDRVNNSPSPTPIISNHPANTSGSISPASCHQGSNNHQLVTTYALPASPDNLTDDPTGLPVECKDDKRGRETLHLLIVILVYVILTIPFALYNLMSLASFLYGNDSFISDDIFTTLKWMQTSRSLLIPLTWTLFFYIEKRKMILM